MKKLTIAANGHPRTNHDLTHLQDAIIDVGKAVGLLCGTSTSTLVLIGGLYPFNIFSQSYDVTEAFFYYNNELFYFAGAVDMQDVTHLRISSVYAANNPYLGKNIHNIRTLIPISSGNIVGDIPVAFTRATDAIAKKSIGSWVTVNPNGSASYPQFYAGVTHVAGHAVRYRKLASGKYEFIGKADVGGYSGSSLGSYSLINFGPGLVTTNNVQYGNVVGYLNGGSDRMACPYSVSNSGISIAHDAGYSLLTNDYVCVSPIQFYEVI